MLNISMPQIILYRPSILSILRELKSTGMPKHMGMYRCYTGRLTYPSNNFSNRIGGQWPFSFAQKNHLHSRLNFQTAQEFNLNICQRLNTGITILYTANMNLLHLKINLIPSQINQFRNSQSVSVTQQDYCCISLGIAP